MSEKETGGPSYPVSLPGWGDNGASGMTLRDYFAGQVAPYFAKIAMDTKSDIKHAAGASYEFADAMLEARK